MMDNAIDDINDMLCNEVRRRFGVKKFNSRLRPVLNSVVLQLRGFGPDAPGFELALSACVETLAMKLALSALDEAIAVDEKIRGILLGALRIAVRMA